MTEERKEKLRAKGLDETSIQIWEQVQENRKKRESCHIHQFEKTDKKFGSSYQCINCGCIENAAFIVAYKQGLQHGAIAHAKEIYHSTGNIGNTEALQKLGIDIKAEDIGNG